MVAHQRWTCTCTPEHAIALLNQIAASALDGSADEIRMLPGAVEHWLNAAVRP